MVEFNIKLFHEDDYWFMNCEDLGIICGGQTVPEAIQDFLEYYNDLSEDYLSTPDKEFTKGALEIKRRYQRIIEKQNEAKETR